MSEFRDGWIEQNFYRQLYLSEMSNNKKYVYVNLCVHVFIPVCVYMSACLRPFVCVCVCVCVCVLLCE